MEFRDRQERAIQLLERSGIGRNTYAPPLIRLLWRCGVRVRPLHFMGFGPTVLLSGAWFTIAWGAVMWFGSWSRHHTDVRSALLGACAAGLFFGLGMAGYIAWQRRKHDLPDWESLV